MSKKEEEEEEEEEEGNVQPKKGKEEKRKRRQRAQDNTEKSGRNWMNCPCASVHGHFCPLSSFIFSLQFSL